MQRASDWEARLAAHLDALRDRPFVWGTHDCTIMAAGCVLAMTDVDPMAEFRGRYTTQRGAAIALGRYGQRTLQATLDAKFERCPPGLAHRGDLVFANKSVGVSLGARAAFVGAEGARDGLVSVPRHEWQAAWRVPYEAAAT